MILEGAKQIKLEELTKLQEQRDGLETEMRDIYTQLGNASAKRFNFVTKNITRRKEFSETEQTKETLNQRIESIKEQIEDATKEIRRFNEIKKPQIESATTLKELGLTFPQTIEMMKQRGLEAKLTSCKEGIEIAPDELTSNQEFMERAIKEDFTLISYDRTNSEELYIKFLDILIAEQQKHEDQFYTSKTEELKDEIINPKEVPEGKYKIKKEQIFEAIRGYTVEGLQDKTMNDDYNLANSVVLGVTNSLYVDGVLSQEEGEKLEEIYNSSDKKTYMHGTGFDVQKDIFTKGLRASSQDSEKRALNRTAKEVTSFLGMAGYTYQNNGNVWPSHYIVQIPENETYIWGSNNPEGDISDCYVQPQYIVGALKFSKEDGTVKEGHFEPNNEVKEKYKYTFENYSIVGKSKPKINEEMER